MNQTLPFLLFALGWASIAAAQDADPLLRPTFQSGREYVIRHDMDTESMLGGAKQTVQINFDMKSRCQRAKGRSGERLVTTTITRLEANMKLGGVVMTYDSTKSGSENDLLGRSFSKILNEPIKAYFNEADEIVEMSEIEGLPKDNPLTQMFGPEQLKKLIAPQLDLGIPVDGVAEGVEWSHDQDNKVGAGIELGAKTKLRYAKNETVDGETCAVVEQVGSISMNLTSQGGEADPKVPLEVKDGDTKGTAYIDKKLRFPRKGEMTLDLLMKIPNPQNPEASLELPVKQKFAFKLISTKRLGLF